MAWFKKNGEDVEYNSPNEAGYSEAQIEQIKKDAYDRGFTSIPSEASVIDKRLEKMEQVVDKLINLLGVPEDFNDDDEME